MQTIITRAGPATSSAIVTRREGGELSGATGVVRRDNRSARLRRAYDYASPGSMTRAAFAPVMGGNATLGPNMYRLRAACRDLARNNVHAKSAIRILVAAMVRWGITPEFPSSNSRTQGSMDRDWRKWVPLADVRGVHDYFGLMKTVAWQLFEAGEVFVRLHVLPPQEAADLGIPIPLQLEIVESEQVTMESWTDADGLRVVNGIKLNKRGRRIGAYVYAKNPDDPTDVTERDKVFLPFFDGRKGELIHVFDPVRCQERGEPYLAVIGTRLESLDVYTRSMLARAQVEACFAGFVKKDASKADPADADMPDPNGLGTDLQRESADLPGIEAIQPGMMHYLEAGESVEFATPTPSGGMADFSKETLRAIASGIGIPYELLTGDLSNVNYASFRAGTMQFREQVEMLQNLVMIPMFCFPIIQLWMFLGYLTNRWDPADASLVKWGVPRVSSVDPVKDAMAILIELKAGITDIAKVKTERGEDWRKDLEAIAEIVKFADTLGLDGFRPEGFGGALARAEEATAESDQQDAKDAATTSGKPQGVTRAPRAARR